MKNILFPIELVTAFAIFYNALPFFNVNEEIIVALFAISPFAVTWMVYRVLKDGTPGTKKFDEYFYEDHHYRRNVPREMPLDED